MHGDTAAAIHSNHHHQIERYMTVDMLQMPLSLKRDISDLKSRVAGLEKVKHEVLRMILKENHSADDAEHDADTGSADNRKK